MKVYTSYFGRMKDLEKAGLSTVGIAVKPPHFFRGTTWFFLAPRVEMLKMNDWEAYKKEFKKILSKLDPNKVKQAFELMHKQFNNDIVLLCFEKDWNDCHRKMVAEWLNEKFGWDVQEFNPISNDKLKSQEGQRTLF